MRTIIAGTRSIVDLAAVERAVAESGFDITCVISGCAVGVDALGEQWAAARGIPIEYYPADWRGLGFGAGPARNEQMACAAGPGGGLIAVRVPADQRSRGTDDMIRRGRAHDLRVFVYYVS